MAARALGPTRVPASLLPVTALWACVVGALSIGALTGSEPTGLGPCLFRLATGAPCPFCGLTHSLFALGGGDAAGSLAFSPLGIAAAATALAIAPRLLSAWRERRELSWPAPVLVAGLIVIALSWAHRLMEGTA